jgi:hypothetical protein
MKIIFSILIFLFVVIPLGGFAFLMYYIIKKSSDKKSPEFLLKQKNEMFKKVLETKTKLVPWKKEYLVQSTINPKFINHLFNLLTISHTQLLVLGTNCPWM